MHDLLPGPIGQPVGTDAAVEVQRRRRILFVSRNHLPHVGGAEISTHHLSLRLTATGHQIHLLTQLRRRSPRGILDVARGRLTRPVPRHSERSLGYEVTRTVEPLGQLPRVCSDLDPDAVVVTATDPVFAVSALDRTATRPSILYVRGAHAVPFVLSGAHYDLVLANSPFIARSIRNLGVDATFLPSVFPRDVYQVDTTREKVLFVNPIPKKGVDIAVHVAQQRPDIPFVFSLSWRMKRSTLRRLRAEARRLGNVEIREATQDPSELFRDTRVILVPTRWPEAWPRVVSEGHISGIPVIGGNVGGIPDAVGPGGVIVDPAHSRHAWLEALSRIWDDPDAYQDLTVEALVHSRRDEMTVDRIVRRFEGIVQHAIEVHSRCS